MFLSPLTLENILLTSMHFKLPCINFQFCHPVKKASHEVSIFLKMSIPLFLHLFGASLLQTYPALSKENVRN